MKAMTSFFVPRVVAAAATLATAALGCGGTQSGTTNAGGTAGAGGTEPGQAKEATAVFEAKSGSTMSGTGTFTTEGNEVILKVEVKGLPPGEHAIHIHEHPDCSSHDAESAMGHWNPTNKAHGKWGTEPFHLGDIGNITVGADGTGTISLRTDLWAVGTGGTNDVTGHALMVHANPDDFTTQPSGNAGARLGCAVINRK